MSFPQELWERRYLILGAGLGTLLYCCLYALFALWVDWRARRRIRRP